MTTWQQRIVEWRFSQSLKYRTLGFLLKGGFELTVLALVIGVFIVVFTVVIGVSMSGLVPLPEEVEYPRLTAWIVLTAIAWGKLRCFTTDGLGVHELDPETETIQVKMRQ